MRKTWVLLLVAAAIPAVADPAPDKILACMRGNLPPALRIQDLQLDATDRSGAPRTLKGRVYAMRDKDKGLLRAVVHINAPQDLSGASYLVRETGNPQADEMFMFLPALNKVRRITGAGAEGSFLGTDFSYDDVKEMENAFGGGQPQLAGTEVVNGRPAQILAFKPTITQGARYSQLRAWVDQQTCVAVKVDFYESDQVRKEFSVPAGGLQQSGTYWYASQAQMRDLKEKTVTTLHLTGVTGPDKLAPAFFEPNSFYLSN